MNLGHREDSMLSAQEQEASSQGTARCEVSESSPELNRRTKRPRGFHSSSRQEGSDCSESGEDSNLPGTVLGPKS